MSGFPVNNHVRECPYCHVRSQFELIREGNSQQCRADIQTRIDPPDEKSAVQGNVVGMFRCVLCGGPLFVRAYGTGHQTLDIYPHKIPDIAREIPDKVKKIFLEALLCFEIKAWNATATMCRRTVQEAVLDKSGIGKDLYNQIEDLAAKNFITPDLKDWAHDVRLIGKDGAHADVPTDATEEDAKYAIDFTDEFLNYIYVLKARVTARKTKAALTP